jgi:hypothetical protein
MVINIKGYDALIDDEDFERVMSRSWCIHSICCGHVYFNSAIRKTERINGKKGNVQLHRFLINAPKGLIVDHINGDTLDNRKCNLRVCGPSGNSMNRAIQGNNTTGYKGVKKSTSKINPFYTQIKYKGKVIHIGMFKTAEEAYIAYQKRAKELFGEYYRENENDKKTSNLSQRTRRKEEEIAWLSGR